jgi:hypothetical protein
MDCDSRLNTSVLRSVVNGTKADFPPTMEHTRVHLALPDRRPVTRHAGLVQVRFAYVLPVRGGQHH